MFGNAIMAINTILQLSSPLESASMAPIFYDRASLVITVYTGDMRRDVSNGNVSAYPFLDQRFRSDLGAPYSITVSSFPDPVIPGTRVQIYRIAALLEGGTDLVSVMQDYPSLTRVQIEDAWAYAKVNPNVGKPYPSKSFKRALREMDFGRYSS